MNHLKLYSKIIVLSSIIIICGLIFTQVCFAQKAEKNKIPENFEQAKTLIIEIITPLPNTIKQLYKDDVAPIFKKTGDSAQNLLTQGKNYVIDVWDSDIKPFTDNITNKIKNFLGKEIEQRKPEIEKEFEKEKQEIKQEFKNEIPEIKQTIWQKIKGFID
ncbi:MAG: hypothetical protein U9Q27_01175 [Patescibacteria group bacterium]|nr:hypothetical protein [Patescibacteria group bacterium]